MQSVHSECNYFGLVRYRHPNTPLEEICTRKKPCFNTDVSGIIWMSRVQNQSWSKNRGEAWQWQWAVELLRQMPAAKVLPNEVSFSGAISACEKAEYFWQYFCWSPKSACVVKVCLTNQGICLCNLKSRNALYFVYIISFLGGEPNIFETFWHILTLFLIASFSYLVSMENH